MENKIPDTELRACPFCGSKGGSHVKFRRIGKSVYVKCLYCGIRTELFADDQEAKEIWNQRECEQ